MIHSHLERWAYRWANGARKDRKPWASFWMLLTWGVVLTTLWLWSGEIRPLPFMTGLVLLIGAFSQFERIGFIRLLEDSNAPEGGSDRQPPAAPEAPTPDRFDQEERS